MLANRAKSCKLCGTLHRLSGDHCAKCHGLMTKPVGHGRAFLRDRRQSYVYAIGVDGNDGSLVKFGYTKIMEGRLRDLQIGSPVRLAILASDFGSRSHEKAIHDRLATDRSHGEWFRRSAKAIEIIQAMKAGRLSDFLGLETGKNKDQSPIVVLGDKRLDA
jgi:hypothetical protein